MRAVVQRVRSAKVTVDGDIVGEIGWGLLIYVGVGQDDGPSDVAYLAKKVSGLRIFEDENGAMNRSVIDVGGAILVVSQFTLYADCRKGRRPSFNNAMEPVEAERKIVEFRRQIETYGIPTAQGRFGSSMNVKSTNCGPVTILLDSSKSF